MSFISNVGSSMTVNIAASIATHLFHRTYRRVRNSKIGRKLDDSIKTIKASDTYELRKSRLRTRANKLQSSLTRKYAPIVVASPHTTVCVSTDNGCTRSSDLSSNVNDAKFLA